MAKIKPQALLLQSKRKKGPTRISLGAIITWNIILILIVLSLYATYRHQYHRSSNQLDTTLENFQHSETFGESASDDPPSYVIVNTEKGSITFELHKDASRDVVDKFVDLCQKGHFTGMHFDHVIKNFVIQGGGSERPEVAGDWLLKVKAQLATSPKHEAFMLGTRKPNKDSKEFELFITTAPISESEFSDELIFFGHVIKGEDVVQEIEDVDTDETFRPKSLVKIVDIALKREA